MNFLKRKMRKNWEEAVSPVVGVMLMLVVTIVIAAVVSGFAGGLTGGAEKAPSLSMDVAIKNTGSFANSYFEVKVLSISEPILTSDLQLITTWGKDGTTHVTNIIPGDSVGNWSMFLKKQYWIKGAPWGYGPGVDAMNSGIPSNLEQEFGNYTLYGGTLMYALPAGQKGGFIDPASVGYGGYGIDTIYTYSNWTYAAGEKADGMQTVLGDGWEALRTGDVVNVKLIHTPSSATIFEKDVVVS